MWAWKKVTPSSVGSIVPLKGRSSTLGIVFFKGESGSLDYRRMPTHRPWEREKRQGQRRREKRAERSKKGGKPRTVLNFICFFKFVFSKQARWLPLGWVEGLQRWGCFWMCGCLCADWFCEANCWDISVYDSHWPTTGWWQAFFLFLASLSV